MIYPVTFYSAKCDHCQLDWANNDEDFAAMSDESGMSEMIDGADWHTEGEKHYCLDCWSYDDDDNIVLNPERKDLHNKNKDVFVRACETEEFYTNAANSDAKCHSMMMTKEFFETRKGEVCESCVYNTDKIIQK